VRPKITALWASSPSQVTPHPSLSADGLVKAPAAGHPLPKGEGGFPKFNAPHK
jgi:hypothetical protein